MSKLFKDALTKLPWETSDDVKQLLSLGAEINKKDAVFSWQKL